MDQIAGSPYAWLEFDKDGGLARPAQLQAVRTIVSGPGVTDLLVISHGWKNDEADARRLYETLWGNVVPALDGRSTSSVAVCGIQWPAKAFQTDFDSSTLTIQAAGGGALSAAPPPTAGRRDRNDAELAADLQAFADFFQGDAAKVVAAASAAVVGGALDPGKTPALFARASELIEARLATVGGADTELRQDTKPLSAQNPHDRLLALAKPPALKAMPGMGAAQDLGHAIGQVFSGAHAAVARFLNQLTYFEMKIRAGTVGRRLGAEILPKLSLRASVRLHLVGHSFGARLVTAAASALPDAMPLFSLTLLQGAFSHNALAELAAPDVPGAFKNVIGRPSGPIVITHTHNDEACTFWYAIASRLSRDTASAIGDKDDAFGAMGANGAQKLLPEALAPDVSDETFKPAPGKVNRFLADSYILKTATVDAHNNITNPTVARLVASVLNMRVAPGK